MGVGYREEETERGEVMRKCHSCIYRDGREHRVYDKERGLLLISVTCCSPGDYSRREPV